MNMALLCLWNICDATDGQTSSLFHNVYAGMVLPRRNY